MLHPDWNLKRDPFPCTGRSLSPRDQPEDLSYYLDLYEWREAGHLRGLEPDGSIRIEAIADVVSTTILISGESGSGRTSIKNLLLYQFEKNANPAPIALELAVPPSASADQLAIALAMQVVPIVMRRNSALLPQVQQSIGTWSAFDPAMRTPELLFQMMSITMQQAAPGAALIVVLDASNHNLTRDAARNARAMLGNFAKCIIMTLTSADDAKFIKTSLQDGSWIDAPYVDAAKIKNYVTHRLAAERRPGNPVANPVHPFAPGAIDELFQATSGNGTLKVSISVVLARLATAMRRKAQAPGAVAVITAADMRALLA